jgi:hypothetical protein
MRTNGTSRRLAPAGMVVVGALALLLGAPQRAAADEIDTTVVITDVTQDPTTGVVEFNVRPQNGASAWNADPDGSCSGTANFDDYSMIDLDTGDTKDYKFVPDVFLRGYPPPKLIDFDIECEWSKTKSHREYVSHTGWRWRSPISTYSRSGLASVYQYYSGKLTIDNRRSSRREKVCWKIWHPGYVTRNRYYWDPTLSTPGGHWISSRSLNSRYEIVCATVSPSMMLTVDSVGAKYRFWRWERKYTTAHWYGTGSYEAP